MKFYYLIFCVLFCLLIVLTIIYSTVKDIKDVEIGHQIQFRNFEDTNSRKNSSMKYILLWTLDSHVNMPLVFMGKGLNGFLKRNCTYTNCFVTTDKHLLGSHAKFDAIVFPGTELETFLDNGHTFPNRRLKEQKYVYANIESAATYDIMTDLFDGYFNWTWTYKLNSDLRWGYIVVRDLKNNIIGPKENMNWLKLEEMDPVTEEFKEKLKTKRKAAAWFASNCQSESRREVFVNELRKELMKHKHVLDEYGDCGIHECPRKKGDICDQKIAKYYYFYLSFENAFSEDYVTEKLLRALKYDAVPIVYGGANYTRFMPDGIYLNALDLGVKKLAAKMIELINDPDKYANYFKWKNHYKYEATIDNPDTNEYCKMCELLNNEEAVKKSTVYKDFRRWWNPYKTYLRNFENKLETALRS